MATNVWEKFNKTMDLEALRGEIKAASENKREFKDVPKGDYEVKVEKLELSESKSGKPMMVCWMKVLAGEYKNQKIFYNQVMHMGFGIHKACEFLSALHSDLVIEFIDFEQFDNLLMDVMESIDVQYEYALQYGEDKKGFSTYEIKEVFEVE